jgi:RNA polymerase sigma-70 factor (ECF subfamily)
MTAGVIFLDGGEPRDMMGQARHKAARQEVQRMSLPSECRSESDHLLGEARDGKRDALGRLTQRYRPYLFRVAAALLDARLPGEASSVVQQSLVAAVQHFSQFRGPTGAAFLAWLTTIVRRTAWNRLARAGRVCPLPAGPDGEDQLAADDSSPSEQASRRERAAALLEALVRLPPDYAEVVTLRNLEDLPFEEVARRMGRSCEAVRQLWVRAFRRLRQEWGKQP